MREKVRLSSSTIAILIAVIAILAGVTEPEIRAFLGLEDSEDSKVSTSTPTVLPFETALPSENTPSITLSSVPIIATPQNSASLRPTSTLTLFHTPQLTPTYTFSPSLTPNLLLTSQFDTIEAATATAIAIKTSVQSTLDYYVTITENVKGTLQGR